MALSQTHSMPDGKPTSAEVEFVHSKVMRTNADGSQTAKTRTQLDITEIALTTDATLTPYADGSQITGQTPFTMGGGVASKGIVGGIRCEIFAR